MGTNLLNLFPFSQTSGLVVVPGYGYCGWSCGLYAACALYFAFPTPDLPLHPVTVAISGFPFGFLAETFREGVA